MFKWKKAKLQSYLTQSYSLCLKLKQVKLELNVVLFKNLSMPLPIGLVHYNVQCRT